MSLPIHVDAYSGYKANERPQQFTLDEEIYEIAAVLDQWYEPTARYFKVQTVERKTYLFRYDEETDEWTLQSADFVEGTEHRSFLRFNSSTLEFIRCSLHHGFRSHIATDYMGLVFRREWYTSK